jgi:hypothetical protein
VGNALSVSTCPQPAGLWALGVAIFEETMEFSAGRVEGALLVFGRRRTWHFPLGFPAMRLITLLSYCHHFPGFVYEKARLCPDKGAIEILELREHEGRVRHPVAVMAAVQRAFRAEHRELELLDAARAETMVRRPLGFSGPSWMNHRSALSSSLLAAVMRARFGDSISSSPSKMNLMLARGARPAALRASTELSSEKTAPFASDAERVSPLRIYRGSAVHNSVVAVVGWVERRNPSWEPRMRPRPWIARCRSMTSTKRAR